MILLRKSRICHIQVLKFHERSQDGRHKLPQETWFEDLMVENCLLLDGNKWANKYERLDIRRICERIASVPVSSKNYIPLDDGRLILLLRRERLSQAEVDVVAIEILRDFANAIEKEYLWQND